MKKYRKAQSFLEELRRIPNVSLACENSGISRNTVYRWCNEDSEFKARMEEALECGVESVSDLAESKMIGQINSGNMRAIQYWLDNHKKEYMRPRPKNFWEMMYPPPQISGVEIRVIDVDEVRAERAKMRQEVQEQ